MEYDTAIKILYGCPLDGEEEVQKLPAVLIHLIQLDQHHSRWDANQRRFVEEIFNRPDIKEWGRRLDEARRTQPPGDARGHWEGALNGELIREFDLSSELIMDLDQKAIAGQGQFVLVFDLTLGPLLGIRIGEYELKGWDDLDVNVPSKFRKIMQAIAAELDLNPPRLVIAPPDFFDMQAEIERDMQDPPPD